MRTDPGARIVPRKDAGATEPLLVPEGPSGAPWSDPAAFPTSGYVVTPPGIQYPGPGETLEQWTYEQLLGLAAAMNAVIAGTLTLGGSNSWTGANNFTQPAAFTNPGSTVAPVSSILDNNNATGVDYPLTLGHSYTGGAGQAGLGVGLLLRVESATEGVLNTAAAFEAQVTVPTNGAMTAEAGIVVVNAGVARREITVARGQTRWVNSPLATPAYATLTLGDGGFTGGGGQGYVGAAAGGWIGVNADGTFTGDLMRLQTGGKDRLVVPAAGGVVIDVSNSYAGNLLELRKNGVLQYAVGNAGALSSSNLLGVVTDALTTTAPLPLRLAHFLSAGTAGANFGVGMEFFAENSAHTQLQIGSIIAYETTVTAGADSSAVSFSNRQSGSTVEALRLTGGGQCQITGTLAHIGTGLGFFAGTPQGQGTVAASASDLASVITLANSLRTLVRGYSLAP
jgi:hypothetical protein